VADRSDGFSREPLNGGKRRGQQSGQHARGQGDGRSASRDATCRASTVKKMIAEPPPARAQADISQPHP